MINQREIFVVIPAFDEEHSIGKVVTGLDSNIVDEVIVVNNNSKDNTVEVAKNAGATVLDENQQGYGAACLKGIAHVNSVVRNPNDAIVVFIDGDYSDYPEELPLVIQPIIDQKADMVIGSRRKGEAERGSLTPQQIFGNWLATTLIKLIYKFKYSDLGPFRAISLKQLNAIKMQDTNYGWTVEMQIKALQHHLSVVEVPVNYKVRIGQSKVSGTLKGTILAGYKIITTIIKYAFKQTNNNKS